MAPVCVGFDRVLALVCAGREAALGPGKLAYNMPARVDQPQRRRSAHPRGIRWPSASEAPRPPWPNVWDNRRRFRGWAAESKGPLLWKICFGRHCSLMILVRRRGAIMTCCGEISNVRRHWRKKGSDRFIDLKTRIRVDVGGNVMRLCSIERG
jgi:hypothetical protein